MTGAPTLWALLPLAPIAWTISRESSWWRTKYQIPCINPAMPCIPDSAAQTVMPRGWCQWVYVDTVRQLRTATLRTGGVLLVWVRRNATVDSGRDRAKRYRSFPG